MTLIEATVWALLVGLLAIGVYVAVESEKQKEHFKAVCMKSGGTPAYDGRQWQCMGGTK